ncbi:rRNA maturation RNase YbeY [Candidatus Kaiserbacteria bacterium]|nr:rRNA maturation RNase YbeY [Candidatus Kaiserbacteria bacterium]
MLDIRTTLRPAPFLKGAGRIPYEKIARKILGGKYELSLVICGDELAKKMNQKYRKRSYRPNVLSFPITKSEGEIFLNVRTAAREARRYEVPLRDRLAFLFVHGCFHLKGLPHGRIMERQEQRILRALHFSCNGQYTQE